MSQGDLYFVVAPHIVQDLGINLYTTLPRVLVEFVANAHDADSPEVDVQMDFEAIHQARNELRKTHDSQAGRLEDMVLPGGHVLKIIDRGHGMSRSEVQERFLVAGRRRREEDSEWSPGGRILMGRKGLGKLAGFGVAKRVAVTSRRNGDDYATLVVLDFDELVASSDRGQIPVPTEKIETDLPPPGTEIALSRLVFEPVKSRRETIESGLANHFRFVGANDFVIKVNGEPVQYADPVFLYEWPDPGQRLGQLNDDTVGEGKQQRTIQYRVRFTKTSLPARERGVRVYASGRLASAPDLLDMPTGMHGFRMSDYIDAVAIADFIDQEPTEYIATDRRSLRWETYFLADLREFLSEKMKRAVTEYQKHRDREAASKVLEDQATKAIIASARLSSRRQKTAMRLARELAKAYPEGVDDQEYRKTLRILAGGLGQGSVLKTLAALAADEFPGFNALSGAVFELAARETDELARFAEGRIDAIETLKKIVIDVDFQKQRKEKTLQQLLEKAPWLINPVFTQLVTADNWFSTTHKRLAKELGIREYAAKNDQTRADLVFLVSTAAGSEVTIVELKAANEPLTGDHLIQLEDYIFKARRFLGPHGEANARVRGILIGSRDTTSQSRKVIYLNDRIRGAKDSSDWEVKDITEVLELTKRAHQELIEIYRRIEAVESE